MKQLIFTCAMLSFIWQSNAQSTNGYTDENRETHKTKVIVRKDDEFAGTEMSRSGKSISFSGLPQMPRPTWAVITDQEGEVIKQAKLFSDEKVIDVNSLQVGLYFVTLTYKNKSRKAFVLNIND